MQTDASRIRFTIFSYFFAFFGLDKLFFYFYNYLGVGRMGKSFLSIYSIIVTLLFAILFVKLYDANKEKEENLTKLRNITGLINDNYNDLIGKLFFDFSLEDPFGRTWTLSKVDAKIKIIVLFNINDCARCLQDYRIYNAITEKYPQKIVSILGISNNRSNEIYSYIIQKNLKYPVLQDSASIVKNTMGIHSSPLLFLLNNNNRILNVIIPGQGPTTQLIENIEKVLLSSSNGAASQK